MKSDAPQLHAIIDSPAEAPAFVGALPPEPWPAFVRLWEGMPVPDVALAVAQLARYGHGGGGPDSIVALVADFPRVAPGGLAAVDRSNVVRPSCCCGLESWRSWQDLLTDGSPPWLGHDPSPWVETRGDEFLVWPDGGLGEAVTDDVEPVRFSREQLAASLAAVEQDLRGFAWRLRDWASALAPEHAQALADRFLALVELSAPISQAPA